MKSIPAYNDSSYYVNVMSNVMILYYRALESWQLSYWLYREVLLLLLLLLISNML